jgi:hypothetical protein
MARFHLAVPIVDVFRKSTGRLPHDGELARLANWPDPYVDKVIVMHYDGRDCDEPELFDPVPANGYVLGVLRGSPFEQWIECYEPRSGRTSLSFDEADYTLSGSVVGDRAICLLLITALLAACAWLWRAGRGEGRTR